MGRATLETIRENRNDMTWVKASLLLRALPAKEGVPAGNEAIK